MRFPWQATRVAGNTFTNTLLKEGVVAFFFFISPNFFDSKSCVVAVGFIVFVFFVSCVRADVGFRGNE